MDDWRYEPARDFHLPLRERFRSLRREVGLVPALTGMVWREISRAYLFGFHRLRVVGRENLPARGPFVMIANHSSHLDAVTMAAALPPRYLGRVFPIAAGDTFFETGPTAAFAALFMNALPLWREKCGSHALGDLRERLASDCCVYILFPEGTRSRTGEMASFKPGIGRLVAGTEVPVVPCHLRGAWDAFSPGRTLPHPARIELRIGPALAFRETANEGAGWRSIASECERTVKGLAAGPVQAATGADGV